MFRGLFSVLTSIIILLFTFSHGVRLSPLGIAATTGLLYQPQIMMMMIVEQSGDANWQEKPKCSEKTGPSATLSTLNPT
jgi:hypothetical protein